MNQPRYDNNLRGALFKNDKQGNEKWPDYRGQCEVGRVEFWMSAWLKKDRNGKTYMSMTFEPKQQQQVQGGTKNPPAPTQPDFDDDIPF